MKKRLLAMALALVMVLSMMPVAVYAADGDYGMRLSATTDGLTDGIKVSMDFKGNDLGYEQGRAYVLFVVDSTKLKLVNYNTGKDITIKNDVSAGLGNAGGAAMPLDDYAAVSTASATVCQDMTNNLLYIYLSVVFGNTAPDYTAYVPFAGVRLSFVGNTKKANLDTTSIRLATVAEATTLGNNYVANVPLNNSNNRVYYGVTANGDPSGLTFTNPETLLDNVALPTPSITLTALAVADDTVEVPDGDTANTVTPTLTPTPANASTDGAKWALYTDANFTTAANVTGVSVNADTGVVTVTKEAAANLTAQSTDFYLQATVGTGEEAIKSTGGKITVTKEAPVATAVAVTEETVEAKLPAYGDDAIEYPLTVKVTDQYGAEMSGQTPTFTTLPAGVEYANGKIKVANTAALIETAETITVGCGTATTDTFTLTIAKGDGPKAPTGLDGEAPSILGGNDGKITGLTANGSYEYSTTENGTYTAATADGDGKITVPAPDAYYIRVALTADELLKYELGAAASVTVPDLGQSAPPSITAHPQDVTVYVGADAKFSVTASSDYTYQWQVSTDNGGTWNDIAGEENNELTVPAVALTDSTKQYRCAVTNEESGKAPTTGYSTAATLTVKEKTILNLTVKDGSATANAWTLDTIAKAGDGELAAGDTLSKVFAPLTNNAGEWTNGLVTVKFYEAVEHEAVLDTDGVTELTPAKTTYELATTLTGGKTYYADIAVTAGELTDYKTAAVTAKGAPTDNADATVLANYAKLTVTNIIYGGGGAATPTFAVTFNAGENGTLNGLASMRVERDDSPKNIPTVTAKEGYTFVGWSVDGKTTVDPKTYVITANTTFTALYNKVTAPAPALNTYITGYPDGSFGADRSVTRAETVTMLSRLIKDFDKNGTYTGTASDIAASDWFYVYVTHAMQKGIVNGYPDGTYDPNGDVSRAELATMLTRFLALATGDASSFNDVEGHWAADSIGAAAKAGIVTGYPDGSYKPDEDVTRAEAVTMINRAMGIVAAEGTTYGIIPNDVNNSHWAYQNILLAMNTDVTDIAK